MIVLTSNKQIEYGITPGGNFCERIITPDGKLFRSTPNVQQFLSWMIQPEADAQEWKAEKERQIAVMSIWWKLPQKTNDEIRGSFNVKHYLKVLQAKYKNK